MRHLQVAALALALLLCPGLATAQGTGSSVVFPSGWAPGQAPCVKQVDGTCVPVSAANPLPTTSSPPAAGSSTQVQGPYASGSVPAGNPVPIGALVTPTIAPSYAAGEQRQMTIDDRGSLRVLLNGPTLTPADGGSTEALITARNSSGVQAPLGVMNRYWTGTAQVLARGDTSGAYVIGKGGSTIATTQVTVGTSATLIAAARVGRQKIGVTVTTAVQCAFGNAGVTLATGWPLAPVAYGADSWDTSAALYGVCAATATIGAREQF